MTARLGKRLPIRRATPDERLSVVEHLSELRNRIIIALGFLAIAFVVAYVFREQLLTLLKRPLPAGQRKLSTFSPHEAFFTTIKVCASAALIGALPVCLYQAYAFVVPAVSDQPRRTVLIAVAFASSLFLAGVAFGYFVVLPVALKFLLSFGGDAFVQQNRASDYLGFATGMLLASGLLFEIPVAMVVLARLGVVSPARFRASRRHAIVVIAVLAALLPGGDPISMLLLMVPQMVLYEFGILVASFAARRREASAAAEPTSSSSA